MIGLALGAVTKNPGVAVMAAAILYTVSQLATWALEDGGCLRFNFTWAAIIAINLMLPPVGTFARTYWSGCR